MDIGGLNVRCLQGIGDVIQGRLGTDWIPKTLEHRLKVLKLDHGGAAQAQDTHNFSAHCGIMLQAKLRLSISQLRVGLYYYEQHQQLRKNNTMPPVQKQQQLRALVILLT